MNEREIFDALDRAQAGLRDCLNELGQSTSADPMVCRSYSLVEQAMATLGDLDTLGQRVPKAKHDKLRERLSEVLRWNSLLSEAVRQDRARIAAVLVQSRKALTGMNALHPTGETPTTCDVSA
ncbi:MAG: hypothetical protein R3F17_01355 [Planctomycetota bacterium]